MNLPMLTSIIIFTAFISGAVYSQNNASVTVNHGLHNMQSFEGTLTYKSEYNFDISPEMTKIESVLSSHFGTKIHLSRKNDGSGKIVIPYEDDGDLNRILDLLNY